MADHPGSSRFRVLFEAALQQYETQTEIPLTKHPLAEQLQNCDSVDSVIALLQEQVQAFSEFRGTDKIMKSLKGVVSVLSTLSAIADLSDSVQLDREETSPQLPRPGIHASMSYLRYALAPSSSEGMSSTLADFRERDDHTGPCHVPEGKPESTEYFNLHTLHLFHHLLALASLRYSEQL